MNFYFLISKKKKKIVECMSLNSDINLILSKNIYLRGGILMG